MHGKFWDTKWGEAVGVALIAAPIYFGIIYFAACYEARCYNRDTGGNISGLQAMFGNYGVPDKLKKDAD